jgi:hypothetical protein
VDGHDGFVTHKELSELGRAALTQLSDGHGLLFGENEEVLLGRVLSLQPLPGQCAFEEIYLHAGRQGRKEGRDEYIYMQAGKEGRKGEMNISACRQGRKEGRDEYIYMQARKEGRKKGRDEYMQARKEGRVG